MAGARSRLVRFIPGELTRLVANYKPQQDSSGNETFGYDASGQVIVKQATPTRIHGLSNITQVACGANHAIALDVHGVVWSWGCSEQNQLGRRVFGRHATDSFTPDPIHIRDVKHIASGDYHSLAVDGKGRVWAWGLNSFGEAGYAKAAGSNEVLLSSPMKIPGLRGKGVVCLAGGSHHSAAVTADGQCFVWGRLDGGQLGVSFSPEQLQDTSLIRYDERNKPRICLRPTPVPGIGKVSHVACGTDHTLFVTREGTAYATGFNSQGQLGLGGEDDVEVAQHIKGKALKDRVVTWAGAGGQFSVVAAHSSS
jgi:regulator of chromosome condensation